MGRFVMTGSQTFALMESLSEALVGRSAVFKLETLSSVEVLKTLGGHTPDAATFIWRCGFAELYWNPELSAADFYHSYVVAYLERDVRSLMRVENLRDSERFLKRSGVMELNFVGAILAALSL